MVNSITYAFPKTYIDKNVVRVMQTKIENGVIQGPNGFEVSLNKNFTFSSKKKKN